MKVTDPFASENAEPPKSPAPDPRYTYSASRVLAGNCPECARPLVVFNDGQSWPLVGCPCGWKGSTQDLTSVRLEAHQTIRAPGDGGRTPPMTLRLAATERFAARTAATRPAREVLVERLAIFTEEALGDPNGLATLLVEVWR